MSPLAVVTLLATFGMMIVIPGQDFLMVVRVAVAGPRRAGIAAAAGSTSGLLIWALASMSGMSALLAENPGFVQALRVAGAVAIATFGAVSIYHAVRSTSAAPAALGDLAAATRPARAKSAHPLRHPLLRGWSTGVLSNLSNVKAFVFFTALFSTLLPRDAQVLDKALLLGTMAAMAFGWFSLVAIVGSLPRVAAAYQRASRRMDIIFGSFFVVIGGILAVT